VSVALLVEFVNDYTTRLSANVAIVAFSLGTLIIESLMSWKS